MLDLDQWPRLRDHDAQLFLQLAGQGRLDGFVGLDLATGKLPQAALVLLVSAPGNEDLAVGAANDRGGYMDAFHV